MTIAAAAGTLVVVVGVLAGPSIVNCSSSAEGLLSCLRQQVVEAGLMPGEEPVLEPVAVVPAESEKPAQVEATAPAEPDLNLVRAEPDGHVIVAGTAQPGIEVEVFANGDLVGKVIAEASGDWVLVPDHPLATGSAEISVGISGSNERSPHTFTVVIPEDKVSAPTITATRPLPSAETAQPPMVAAEPTPAVEPTPTPEPQPSTVSPVPGLVEAPTVAATEPATALSAPVAKAADAVPKPVDAAPVVVAQPEAAPVLPIEQAPATKPSPVVPVPVQEPPQLAEAAPPAPVPVAPDVTPVPPAPATIDAIEIDGRANYFAGAGPEGATVQLYVQDRFIASAKVEGGRWLVEASGVLNLPVQRVRIDLIKPQQGDVAARAEVNFVIDVPPIAPDIEVAGSGSGAVAPANSAAGALAFAPQVDSKLEVDPAIPTLRALPSVEPGMMRFASGKAIIRRGETLWAIAARVYGDGSLYRRIVEANDGLIRSPGRIYPGQVFDLPKLQEPTAAN